MTTLNRLAYQVQQADNFVLFEDWEATNKLTYGPFTLKNANSGTATVGTGLSGLLTFTPSGGTPAISDELYVYSSAVFLPSAGYPIYFEAYEQFTQVNTNTAGYFYGLASGVSAGGLITAAAAGIRTTGTVIGFYMVSGKTTWQVIAQNNGTTYTADTGIPAGLSTYQKLTFEILDAISSTATVVFRVDDELVRNANTPQVPLTFLLPLASATACAVVFGNKNGTVTNGAESGICDYISCTQLRQSQAGTDL